MHLKCCLQYVDHFVSVLIMINNSLEKPALFQTHDYSVIDRVS